jgi:hypothetical protein
MLLPGRRIARAANTHLYISSNRSGKEKLGVNEKKVGIAIAESKISTTFAPAIERDMQAKIDNLVR